jgi:CBS domain-containing protein
MTLGDLVVGTAHVCGPETTLEEAAAAMRAAGHGSLGVVEGGALIGLLTERDIVGGIGQGLAPNDVVRKVTTPDPDVFDPSVDVFEAAEWLLESGYRHLPVVENGRLLGVVSVTDVLGAVLDSVEEEE